MQTENYFDQTSPANSRCILPDASSLSESRHIPDGMLGDTFEEVLKLAELKDNWNDEGAPLIDRACILRACRLILWLRCEIKDDSLSTDSLPEIFPTIEGGLEFYWKAQGRMIALTMHPGKTSITLREKAIGEPALFHNFPVADAAEKALQIMRGY